MRLDKKAIQYIFFQPIKIDKTFWVVLLLICSLSAGAFSFYKAVKRIGKPFQGFFIGPNLMVSVGQRAPWPGVKAGLKPLDKVLEVNGEAINNIEQFRNIISLSRIGKPMVYRIERGNEIKMITVPIRKISALDFLISFLGPFSIGLVFIAIGAFTIFYVPNLRVSYLYFILCSLIGVYCLVFNESYTSHTFFRFMQVYPLIAAVAVHLFAVFPESKKITDARTLIVFFSYLAALFIVGLREYFLYDQDIAIALSRISSFYVAFTLLANIGLLIDTAFSAETNVIKDKAKVLLAGVIIASSAVGLWSMNFAFKSTSFFLDEAILLSLVFPIFMTYAILKKNIFDIDRVIRVSLTYAASTGVVILVYFIVVAMVGFMWPGFLGTKGLIGVFAILALIGAFIFNPLTRKMKVFIYKILFRAKYNRLQSLMAFGRKLSSGLNIDEISDLLVRDLVDLMGLKGAFLVTFVGDHAGSPVFQLARGIDPEKIGITFEKDSHLTKQISFLGEPKVIGELKNVKTVKSVDRLRGSGIDIMVPMKLKDELLAILCLMGKTTRDIFTAEDLEFLEAISNQAAVAFENAKLYIEKARRERLAAIGEVASVIIHEVKNPLGVIKVASGTIKRKSKEGENTHELATFIGKEVDRMNSTITQILNFAKPKENRLEEFALDDLVSDVVSEMRPGLSDLKISIREELSSGNGRVIADKDKVRRALINLLTNAKGAVKQGDMIMVRTRLSKAYDENVGHMVEIEVEDFGEGIDEKDIRKIFQPFYTTRQEGTGLGLSIVSQIASDHDGTVTVESKKGFGSKFTLSIPRIKQGKIGEGAWTMHTDKEL